LVNKCNFFKIFQRQPVSSKNSDFFERKFTFARHLPGNIEGKSGPPVALEFEIGYNKKRSQINFTPEKENE
jgi:hypothetical protein